MHHAMSEHELLSATERNELDRAGGRASGDGAGGGSSRWSSDKPAQYASYEVELVI